MKISNCGIDYYLIGNGTKILNNLPAKVFNVNFNKSQGLWLSERSDLIVGNFKVYGTTPARVEKVFRAYKDHSKNLGILLSGEKGMGKSVFIRSVAERAIQENMPVIVIDEDLPGLINFIQKIEQPCVILFDEFEKKFPINTRYDDDNNESETNAGSQTQFLSLFDGMDNGKKLFVVAINEVNLVSEFFINRPGRFYYHYKFHNLDVDEIREYLTDRLTVKDSNVIDQIILLGQFNNISYDMLAAIVNELNRGYSLDETLNDLNIESSRDGKCWTAKIVYRHYIGKTKKYIDYTLTCEDFRYNPSGYDSSYGYFFAENASRSNLEMYINPRSISYDSKTRCINSANCKSNVNIASSTYFREAFGKVTEENFNRRNIISIELTPRKISYSSDMLNYLI